MLSKILLALTVLCSSSAFAGGREVEAIDIDPSNVGSFRGEQDTKTMFDKYQGSRAAQPQPKVDAKVNAELKALAKNSKKQGKDKTREAKREQASGDSGKSASHSSQSTRTIKDGKSGPNVPKSTLELGN